MAEAESGGGGRTPPTSGQLSGRMMEAQAYFQEVVKRELQVLVASGLEREVAVRVLLHRIVESTEEPEECDVKRVMRQFQMNYDDAVRALIVKQEIGRLKRQGLDAFAAIEELTRKMQRINFPLKAEEEEKENEQATSELNVNVNEDMEEHSTPTLENEEVKEEETDSPSKEGDEPKESEGAEEKKEVEEQNSIADTVLEEAPLETTEAQESDSNNDSPQPATGSNANTAQETVCVSSTLCQRIDQVSISAASPENTLIADDVSPPTTPSALATTRHFSTPPPRTAFTLFSAHSRKRRVTSVESSPSSNVSSPLHSTQRPRSPLFSSRPLSPTFRPPNAKKQKIWTTDEGDEPYFDGLTFKTATILPPASPTAVSINNETPLSSANATPTKMGKRRRAVRSGVDSPELDDLDPNDPVIRLTKRHKL